MPSRRSARPARSPRRTGVGAARGPTRKGFGIRIVFAGTPAAATPSLAALLASEHEVVGVLSRPDAPTGRGRRPQASPVSQAALAAGVPLFTPPSARGPEFLDLLTGLAPDVAVVVAYGALLPPAVLAVPRHGWINLHFSLLPAWRGAAPVQAAVRAGDDITGASTFLLDAGMDTGPVFGVVTEPVSARDTAGEVLERLATSGARLLVATVDGVAAGTLRPVPQSTDGVSLAPKITVADAEIDWSAPAAAVDRAVRAVTPEPGAWTGSPWGRLGVGPVFPVDHPGLTPGEVLLERGRVLVGTATTAVALSTVRAPGKREMPAPDWARGARPGAGARLGVDGGPGDGAR